MSQTKTTFPLCVCLCMMVVAIAGCEDAVNVDSGLAEGEKKQQAAQNVEPENSDSKWLTSYDEAAKLSKETGKPMLVDFTGSDWCGWCIKLKEEVFSKPEFDAWADENVVLLELDFPRKTKLSQELTAQNNELKDKYEIRGFPTILFLDSEGEKLGQYGYDRGGPDVWIPKAEAIISGAE